MMESISQIGKSVKHFFCGQPVVHPEYIVWKKILVGNHKKIFSLHFNVNECGTKISSWANDIFFKDAFKLVEKEQEIQLVKLSVAELGFKEGATFLKIYISCKKLGLDVCPAETAPQLCIQHKDLIEETLYVAMDPIVDSAKNQTIFEINNTFGVIRLDCEGIAPDYFFSGKKYFIFCVKKKVHLLN